MTMATTTSFDRHEGISIKSTLRGLLKQSRRTATPVALADLDGRILGDLGLSPDLSRGRRDDRWRAGFYYL